MDLKKEVFDKSYKKGQVTIFIIIAILVVAIGVLIYFFFPGIRTTTTLQEENPYLFFENCIGEKVDETIGAVSLQGGSVNPVHTYGFEGETIEYLCYTNDYYELCTVQQPLLVQHIEREIKNEISEETNFCFNSLETNYVERDYETNLDRGETNVEILPERIVISFDTELTTTKDDSFTYRNFNITVNENLYQIAGVANSILEWETTYGDAETSTYMDYYQNLKVQKYKQIDGTTIYVITDRDTGYKFQFASRSLVFPPGYSLD